MKVPSSEQIRWRDQPGTGRTPTRPAEQMAAEMWDHGSSQGSVGIEAVFEHTLHGEVSLGKR